MCITPSTAMTTNQRRVTGPNSFPTRSVPWRWIRKIAAMIPTVMGTM
jgi:hypothetical protein